MAGTAIDESTMRAEMPKYTVTVINTPEAMINVLVSMPVAFWTGIANIATPTPNQPTCVPLSSKDGSQEPFEPKEKRANKWLC